MAVIQHQPIYQGPSLDFRGVFRAAWRNIKSGDTLAPIALARYTDRSFQISGTFSGATVTIQGTHDTTFVNLRGTDGLELTGINPARMDYIRDPTAYLQALIVGGDASTDLTLTIMCTGNV